MGARQHRGAAAILLAAISTGAACAQLIGADFDVHAADADAGPGQADAGPDTGPREAGSPDASCDAAHCIEVIQGDLANPWDITTNGGYVFWTVAGAVQGTGSVMSWQASGGAVKTLAQNLNTPNRIFATAETVYWSGTDGVWRIPRAGGQPEIVASEPGGAIGVYVTADTVYWVAEAVVKSLSLTDGGTDGGTVLTHTYGGAGMITGDGTYIYFSLYEASGPIYRLDPQSPMQETPLVTGQAMPNGMALVSHYLIFASTDTNGAVSIVDVDGGSPSLLASGQATPTTVAADDFYAYWPTILGGEIKKTTWTQLGGPITLATGQTSPSGIALDDQYVYWTNYDPVAGAVLRTTKK